MDTKKLDTILSNASVEDLANLSKLAQNAKASLVRLEGDYAGTWSIWSIIPDRCPDWLLALSRTSDAWTMGFIAESLGLISSDVRVVPNGKPWSNIFYYKSAGYRDDVVLIKWSSSSQDRLKRFQEFLNEELNTVGAARRGYEEERLEVFLSTFENIYKQFKAGDVAEDYLPEYDLVKDKVITADVGFNEDSETADYDD